ncbi:hypothetical protein [Streptomyces laculatispora]|uniref:hypothetical protein n=1 Tax=Streptomyces laculatispora TaxID=887464 RepID=UPI001A951990|nr:hypothetical protein [Streptomyces laculatispora]MBO0917534.1 hypothetical protein [Streptomyces laculatispora]
MKVRMKVQMSGTRNGEEWPARGEVADLPTGEAQHLVASGIAEEASAVSEPEVETATAPNTAEKRTSGRKTTGKG